MLKVLAIAPYPDLKTGIDQVAQKFPQMSVESYVGDLGAGVEAMQKHSAGFDIILSRGGTAKRVREATDIPVVDIEISFLDILRIIKLVDVYEQKYAFVGFENITKHISTLSEVLSQPLDIITIEDQDQLPKILQKLKAGGYSLIIGDNVTARSAQKVQLNSILIESGQESLFDALSRTQQLGEQLAHEREKAHELIAAHNVLDVSSYIFDTDLHLISGQISPKQPNLTNFLKQYLTRPSFTGSDSIDHIRIHDRYFQLDVNESNSKYYLFIKEVTSRIHKRNFIHNMSTITPPANSADLVGESKNQIEAASSSRSSVIVSGENGTGKRSALMLLASNNSSRNKWLINLKELETEGEWNHLLTDAESILLDPDSSFYIEGIDCLTTSETKQLCAFICNVPSEPAQWVLSVNPKINSGVDNLKILASMIDPYWIRLKPLRDRQSELSSIIGLYVYEFNRDSVHDVLGFEPNAMDLLHSFSWPGNLKQLKRVVKRLVLENKSSFIQTKKVKEALKQEAYSSESATANDTLAMWHGQTLEEIEKASVAAALSRNHGNKTRTASQLGISRSTLWRIIKESK